MAMGERTYEELAREVETLRKEVAGLEESRAYLKSVLDHVSNPVSVLDTECHVLLMNSAAREFMLGRSCVISPILCHWATHHSEIPCHEDPSQEPCPVKEIQKTGQPFTSEHVHYRADGEQRTVEITASPLLDSDGSVYRVVESLHDITDRKRMEREREKLIASLEEALARVKTLRGLLPICAWCKKVRDDDGYWEQVEKYVVSHSRAKFTHGICPQCMEELEKEDREDNRDTPA
jgi:signal transduction histidine kinase